MEFEQIYRTYFRQIYLYALKLCGDGHIAEEITSDTFFKAINSVDKFRGECDVCVWLCRIAKNTYYSRLKKEKKVLFEDNANLLGLPDENALADLCLPNDDGEEAQRLRVILHTLGEPYKEVFMWRVFGELSFKQIGDLYGKTDNWACVTYHRTVKMIKRKSEELNHEK